MISSRLRLGWAESTSTLEVLPRTWTVRRSRAHDVGNLLLLHHQIGDRGLERGGQVTERGERRRGAAVLDLADETLRQSARRRQLLHGEPPPQPQVSDLPPQQQS